MVASGGRGNKASPALFLKERSVEIMHLPEFTAEASLGPSRRTYHGKFLYGNLSPSSSGLPASVQPNQLEGLEGLVGGADGMNGADLGDAMDGMGEMEIGGEVEVLDEAGGEASLTDLGAEAGLMEGVGAEQLDGNGMELEEELS
jgi:hypothetical protein